MRHFRSERETDFETRIKLRSSSNRQANLPKPMRIVLLFYFLIMSETFVKIQDSHRLRNTNNMNCFFHKYTDIILCAFCNFIRSATAHFILISHSLTRVILYCPITLMIQDSDVKVKEKFLSHNSIIIRLKVFALVYAQAGAVGWFTDDKTLWTPTTRQDFL